jgi:hypothetical protein
MYVSVAMVYVKAPAAVIITLLGEPPIPRAQRVVLFADIFTFGGEITLAVVTAVLVQLFKVVTTNV